MTDLTLDLAVLGTAAGLLAIILGIYLHRVGRSHLHRVEGSIVVIEDAVIEISGKADELITIGRAHNDRLEVLESQVQEIRRQITLAPAIVQAERADAARHAEADAWSNLNPVARAAQNAGELLGSVVRGFTDGVDRMLRRRRR